MRAVLAGSKVLESVKWFFEIRRAFVACPHAWIDNVGEEKVLQRTASRISGSADASLDRSRRLGRHSSTGRPEVAGWQSGAMPLSLA
jgi:hypothetical protein